MGYQEFPLPLGPRFRIHLLLCGYRQLVYNGLLNNFIGDLDMADNLSSFIAYLKDGRSIDIRVKRFNPETQFSKIERFDFFNEQNEVGPYTSMV